ncbi:DNA mismatch repair protein MutS [Clostridium oryzae]|uniref:DNA mismatch repair protein MutS n=1 Tax=Clostridium oryzae TaxID=1450648 RepID=A0A1V4I9H7_9CLOT|nr:DNA mismatch repair protein MutS [Clostridium oryzae]OPJ56589.1 DNA mismatch repair protein MutS [Clostridium oryzae]
MALTPTPMMQQYLGIKEKCKDCILFFRLGDFYEMFFEDAEIASRELELVLTGKDCGLEERAPMCGIPFHAANNYIGRLICKGYKIAICEQMEDPALAKGIVKRDIIKIITPGTFTDSMFLEETKNNYIMSIYVDEVKRKCSLCFADISTGDFYTTSFILNYSLIIDEISKYSPKEILVENNLNAEFTNNIKNKFNVTITKKDLDYFKNEAEENLAKQFSSMDLSDYDSSIKFSANCLINYFYETQKLSLSNISRMDKYDVVDFMSIDINTRRDLELTENVRDKSKKGSLLWVLDKTNTAMGSRKLRKWIEQPLINSNSILNRLNAVDELKNNYSLIVELKECLKKVYDIERITGKVSSQSVNAKELISLKNSIVNIPDIKNLLGDCSAEFLKYIYSNMDELQDIFKLIDDSIMDSPSLSVKEGNVIKDGFNSEIDELRLAKANGKEWIAALENKEREVTGIKSLKIGYNKVFGYYIEISKANFSSIPEGRYIRKQTLTNAERFITEDLKNMEEKILGAEEKLFSIEYSCFVGVRDEIENNIDRIKNSAALLSELDCILSLAQVSLENNYSKPAINDSGYINIKSGRHPVIEKVISGSSFISNDTFLNTEEQQLLIITGPNMAGKSTYMRQVALITLMAQIGCFVPAETADISICDKIFTRIGASDDLFSGKSTFMVEMSEVSNILNNATNRSLVLLDEVGRGTSTYDGLSIAWAVIEYICCNKGLKCKTLFATHYHELTKLENMIPGVKNYCVSVKEIGGEVVFLRKIIAGASDQSYGIEVAKLAGLPEAVIENARSILNNLESNKENSKASQDSNDINDIIEETAVDIQQPSKHVKTKNSAKQIDFIDFGKDSFIQQVASVDVLNLTPLESINKLNELIKSAKGLL